MASRILKLRRPDTCAGCGTSLMAGTAAYWDADARAVTCLDCHTQPTTPVAMEAPAAVLAPAPTPVAVDRGVAGASAAREHERRRRAREMRVRERHPLIGGLILAVQEAPQSESAWEQGQAGEERLAKILDARVHDGAILADRRIPGSRANIDFIAIAPTGVYVIDAKHWKGRVRVERPLFGKPRVRQDGRERTKVLDGMDKQTAVVRDALATAGLSVSVHGILCFTQADLPWGAMEARSHLLLSPRATAKRLNADGPLGPELISTIERTLASALPPA